VSTAGNSPTSCPHEAQLVEQTEGAIADVEEAKPLRVAGIILGNLVEGAVSNP
jgi:hypothetical protein